ncbi:MAG TPA: CHAT domain-containing protein, partial [Planctomycetota bacterium]|nr:CHAT domain-containing protein [Planctomycetota bacterium]
YTLAPGEARAFVVTQDGARIASLGESDTIRVGVAALRLGSSGPEEPGAKTYLTERLIAPLRLPHGTKQVLVSPEGDLAHVPFALLLPDTIDVAYVPSGTLLGVLQDEQRMRQEVGKGVLAAGDPEYGNVREQPTIGLRWGPVLAPLPQSRAEVKAIAKGPADVALLGAEASEGRLRQVLGAPGPAGQTRWRCIHLACHGLLDVERPSDSALALSRGDGEDGFLTVLEIFRLRVPADLVVLSACQTGQGPYVRGEGVIGLPRAFMYAGAPRVLVSLWNVDDAATKALMVAFHDAWKPGVPAARALHAAQIAVRDEQGPNGKRKWENPRYWAAWSLWGLPD